jgi:hypothetical protein
MIMVVMVIAHLWYGGGVMVQKAMFIPGLMAGAI